MNILQLTRRFSHSYSQEFGGKVDAEHPERYKISYRVSVKKEYVSGEHDSYDLFLGNVHCEYHSDNDPHWWISPFSYDWDKAFENAGVECGYYSRKKALELLSAATMEWLKIMHDKGYYQNTEIVA